jgi:hypothetical protein
MFFLANSALRSGDYQTAYNLYLRCAQEIPHLRKAIDANLEILKQKRTQLRQENDAQNIGGKIVVYTVNVGGYESVKEPLAVHPGVEYILFTDDSTLTSKHWKVVLLETSLSNPRRVSRLPKILPHKFLPKHDISVYIDSTYELKAFDIRQMVAECMEGEDIALYRHYKRDCVYDEIVFVMNSKDRMVLDKALCRRAIDRYKAINYPTKNGLFENSLILRRNTEDIRELNEIWWEEYQSGTERDQFVLMYALHKSNIHPNAIKIGKQVRFNKYVNFYPHVYKTYGLSEQAGL